jgi:hypothetical protein
MKTVSPALFAAFLPEAADMDVTDTAPGANWG